MYLIRTALSGTQFVIQFIQDQPNKAPSGVDLGETSLTGDSKILTAFPIGTVFAVSEISWGELTSKILGQPRALFYGDNVYVGLGATCTNADVDYLFDWMLSTNEIKRTQAIEYATKFMEGGYHIDIDAKCKAYTENESGTLRDRIMRMYPCPSEEEIGFHIEPDIWYLLIRNIMRGENTLLIGPTGLTY